MEAKFKSKNQIFILSLQYQAKLLSFIKINM